MKTRLVHVWEYLLTSYWFIPSAMLAGSIVAAFAMLWVDRHWTAPRHSAWIYTGGAAGARSLLSTVAGSVITVAGVVFSITLAALVQASSQFGPRLLRNFMRDTSNQVVLGTFVATFIYCLLILRSIRGQDDYSFVPNMSVTGAVALAMGSLVVLIYFFDHVSRSLQAPQIVAGIGRELERSLDSLYPGQMGNACRQGERRGFAAEPAWGEDEAALVCESSGYLQAIDQEGLLATAGARDLVVRLACRPGDYVMKGSLLLRMRGEAAGEEGVRRALRAAFIFGRQRTAEQDVEYRVRQLVEVAVRALSPGINDPFTAINCIDWLGAALAAAARRGLPGAHRYDREGQLRVIAEVTTFAGLASAALDQIRQYGRDSAAVTIRLLEVIRDVGRQVESATERRALLEQAETILRQSEVALAAERDKADVRLRFATAAGVLGVAGAGVHA